MKSTHYFSFKNFLGLFLLLGAFLLGTFLFSCSKISSNPPPLDTSNKLSITTVSPSVLTPGETITITGNGFSSTASNDLVSFSGLPAKVTASSSTSLTVTVPSGLMSASPITIEVNGVTVTSPQTYPLMKPGMSGGSITRISPDTATIGTTITLTGTGFSTTKDSNLVTINSVNAPVVTASATQLTLVVPAGSALANNAAGTLDLVVRGGGVLFTASNPFTVQSSATPNNTITSVSPSSFIAGVTITISGSGFSSISSQNLVQFTGNSGSGNATAQGTLTNGALSVTVPQGVHTGNISVKVNGTALSGSIAYAIINAPTVIAITSSGPYYVGSTITLSGMGFSTTTSQNQVFFQNTGSNTTLTKTSGSSSNGTTLNVIIPTGAVYGILTVQVNGISATQTTLSYIISPSPTFTGITPSSQEVGKIITINGTGFSNQAGQNQVIFTGLPTPVNGSAGANNGTNFTVTVPTGATTGKLSVTINGVATNVVGGPLILTVTTPVTPTFTSFSPSSQQVGQIITINGSGFSNQAGQNQVVFSGVSSPVNGSASTNGTSFTVTVPTGATSGNLSVKVNGVNATGAGTSMNFTVLSAPPTFTGFSPTSQHVAQSITINGSGFSNQSNQNQVVFPGVSSSVSGSASTNGTSFTVTVPTGATSGNLSVKVNGVNATGNGTSTTFTVLPSPTVTSISPSSASIGQTITITGSGFSTLSSQNVVTFTGGVTAIGSSTDGINLNVTVPTGATSGNVTVSVGGVNATGATLTLQLTAPTNTIVSLSPTSVQRGFPITITGEGFDPDPSKNTVIISQNSVSTYAATASSVNGNSLTVTVPVTTFLPQNGDYSVNVAVGAKMVKLNGTLQLHLLSDIEFSNRVGKPGDQITITSPFFGNDPTAIKVKFNEGSSGTPVTATISSTNLKANSITITVPPYPQDGLFAYVYVYVNGTLINAGMTQQFTWQ